LERFLEWTTAAVCCWHVLQPSNEALTPHADFFRNDVGSLASQHDQ